MSRQSGLPVEERRWLQEEPEHVARRLDESLFCASRCAWVDLLLLGLERILGVQVRVHVAVAAPRTGAPDPRRSAPRRLSGIGLEARALDVELHRVDEVLERQARVEEVLDLLGP
jgi:hypothetical protein